MSRRRSKQQEAYFRKIARKEEKLHSYVFPLEQLTLGSYRPLRSGIIPYQLIGGELFFYLGVDRKYQEYSDFGGSLKKKEDPISGAIREFKEETYEVFDRLRREEIKKSIAVYSSQTLVIFYRLCSASAKNLDTFAETIKKHSKSENSQIVRLSDIEFTQLIYDANSKMYDRLRNLLITDNALGYLRYYLLSQPDCSVVSSNSTYNSPIVSTSTLYNSPSLLTNNIISDNVSIDTDSDPISDFYEDTIKDTFNTVKTSLRNSIQRPVRDFLQEI